MTLKQQLSDDMKSAMRAKDSITLSTIRLVNAAIKQFEVDERKEVDDTKVIAIITKMVKQRKDSAAIYTDANRLDLADKENNEIKILNEYLPTLLTETEIQNEIMTAIKEVEAATMADMGKIMGILKNKLAGKADMGLVNKLLKAQLS